MMRWSAGVLVLSAACGPNESPKQIDAAMVDTGIAIDSAPPTRCQATAPFGAPTLVPAINTAADEYSFRISADGLTAVIGRQVNTSQRLFIATRPSLTAPFGTPTQLNGDVSSDDANSGQLYPTATTLYFETARDGDFNIALTTRASPTTDFGNVAAVSPLETGEDERWPYFVPNGNLYFFRSTVGVMLWPAGGATTPNAVAGLAMSRAPALSTDELEIFVSEGTPSVIKHATRGSNAAPFGTLNTLTALSGTAVTEPTFVSANACELYFSADRAGGTGGRDIWVSSRL